MLNPLRLLGSGPKYLVFLVTARCTMACPACFNWRRGAAARAERELTVAEAVRFGQSLPRLYQLTIGGGEPTLRDDLVELVNALARTTDPMAITVTTNGWEVDRIVDQMLAIHRANPRRRFRVAISLDGLEAVHDRLRRPGSYARVRQLIERLAPFQDRDRFGIDINTCVSRDNLEGIPSLVDEVRRLPVRCHTVSLIRGQPREARLKQVTGTDYQQVLERLHAATPRPKDRFQTRLLATTLRVMNDLVAESMQTERQVVPCLAGRRLLTLFEDGTLAACETLMNGFGTIRDYGYDYRKMIEAPANRKILESISRGECHCTWECALAVSAPYCPRIATKIIRATLFPRQATLDR